MADHRTDSVDIILLAAGCSRRFGPENKLLQPFMGKPVIEWALELAVAVQGHGRVLVVYSDAAVRDTAARFPVELLPNRHPDRGRVESARLAVAASTASYYLFMPGDQPLLDAATVATVVARRRPGYITVPCHGDVPGTPALFSHTFRSELLALPDGQSPRWVRDRNPDRVVWVPVPDPLILRDIDTPQDLTELEALARIGSAASRHISGRIRAPHN